MESYKIGNLIYQYSNISNKHFENIVYISKIFMIIILYNSFDTNHYIQSIKDKHLTGSGLESID